MDAHEVYASVRDYRLAGRWIASGGLTDVLLWDAKSGKVKQNFFGLTEWVNVVAFSPDGKILAVCAGGGRGSGKETKTSGELRLYRLDADDGKADIEEDRKE